MSEIVDPSPTPCQPPPDPLPGIIQFGSINLLAGAPGVGKTALVVWLLKQLRDGGEIFGRRATAPPMVAYLCIDRGWYVARTWLDRAEFGPIRSYALADDDTFNLEILHNKRARLAVLKQCLDKLGVLPVGTVVIIDPLALFLGGNLNDYDTCAIFLVGIRRIIRERGLTVIGLMHASKQKNDKKEQYKRLQDRIVGSTAQHGYADTQMYLASPDETGEKFYTFVWAPHLSPSEAFKLERTENGLFAPYGDPRPTLTEQGPILSAIPGTEAGIGFGDLVTQLPDLSRSTIHRYLGHLVEQGVVERVGHGRYRQPSTH